MAHQLRWQEANETERGDAPFRRQRDALVQQLAAEGIRNARVLDAMRQVPRHRFVDVALQYQAYANVALPIGHRQTISQPYIVARMLELLLAPPQPNKVLEIGVGCGYQTALLAHLVPEVFGVERIQALFEQAKANLRPFRFANVRLKWGDGAAGLPEAAPFDAILVAAACAKPPAAWFEQLEPHGRIVAPMGDETAQWLTVWQQKNGQWVAETVEPVRFVPLVAGVE